MEDEDEEDDSEDAINEFDFLGSGEDGEGSPDPRRCASEGNPHELGELGTDCEAWLGQDLTLHASAASCPGLCQDGYTSRGGSRIAQAPSQSQALTLPWKVPGSCIQAALPEVKHCSLEP